MKLVDLVKEAKFYRHELVLWPRSWKSYKRSTKLDWEVFPFRTRSLDHIPDKPGVYAFVVRPNIACNLHCSYLMYVGETSRSLKKRFNEYLAEAKDPTGRPKVTTLLSQYRGFLYFSCAALNSRLSPKAVEADLLRALIPPMNAELPVEVRRVVAAFRADC